MSEICVNCFFSSKFNLVYIHKYKYMKNIYLTLIIIFAYLNVCSQTVSFSEQLANLPGLTISKEYPNLAPFEKSYKLMIRQPLDHDNPDNDYFEQKVYLLHRDKNAPVVYFLGGYNVDNNKFVNELAYYLNANFVYVEHRFFGESVPDSLNWKYLTIEQSAADHHHIRNLFSKIYPGKWLSSGISKGGQTVMFHRAFFPGDVDASVVYVAPLNFAAADERIDSFLQSVSSKKNRSKITDYQNYILSNYNESFNIFKSGVDDRNLKFKHSTDTVFELSVMEADFAFWQWSGDPTIIPDTTDSLAKAVEFLFSIGAAGFFETVSLERTFPFFVQAYKEIGLYNYNTEKVIDKLRAYKGNMNNYETFIPKDLKFEYTSQTTRFVKNVLDTAGVNMIYIYGELDPWSATAYTPPATVNSVKFVNKDGNHTSRIKHLSERQQKEALKLIKKWMGQRSKMQEGKK